MNLKSNFTEDFGENFLFLCDWLFSNCEVTGRFLLRSSMQEEREHQFEVEIRCRKNLEVRRMAEDGNCLFRAVADQVYGDAEMYDETRQMCIDYMVCMLS